VGEQQLDLVVDERVVVEIKAVKRLLKEHETQLLGYLRNTRFQIGLLINFSSSVEVRRLILTNVNK
jgi:GxxExxY protein